MNYALAGRAFNVYRQTAFILDSTAATASITITRQPKRECVVQVKISGGTANTGTVLLTGTVSGSAGQTETLTFTGAGTQLSTKRFTAISAVTTSGLADEDTPPTITIEAVGTGGSRQNASYLLRSGVKVSMNHAGTQWAIGDIPGSSERESVGFLIPYDPSWTTREGDVFIDDWNSEQYMVEGVSLMRGPKFGSPVFYQVRAVRRDGSV